MNGFLLPMGTGETFLKACLSRPMEKRPVNSSLPRSRKDFLAAALFTALGILSLGYWKPGQKAAAEFQAGLKNKDQAAGKPQPFKVEAERRAVSRKST